jgi:acyl carrier protein
MTNTMETIEDRCRRVICEQTGIGLEELTRKTSLLYIGFDSLDGIGVMLALEEEFGIEIPDEDTGTPEQYEAKTFGDVVEYIERRLSV